MQWQFWALEATIRVSYVVTPRPSRSADMRVRAATVARRLSSLAGGRMALTATGRRPRTNRIYLLNEQIYQGVGRNSHDLHRAQMCNDGRLEYGRLQCVQSEYNKDRAATPILLSLVYRVAGVRRGRLPVQQLPSPAWPCSATIVLAELLFTMRSHRGIERPGAGACRCSCMWSNTAAVEPVAALLCAGVDAGGVPLRRVRTTVRAGGGQLRSRPSL
jgi:hypothetical protein